METIGAFYFTGMAADGREKRVTATEQDSF